jgi:iron(III) transport system permease protein
LVTSRSETFGWLIFGLQQGGYTQQAAALSTLLLIALFALAAGIQALRRHAKPS